MTCTVQFTFDLETPDSGSGWSVRGKGHWGQFPLPPHLIHHEFYSRVPLYPTRIHSKLLIYYLIVSTNGSFKELRGY